jgi:hypothetical protein
MGMLLTPQIFVPVTDGDFLSEGFARTFNDLSPNFLPAEFHKSGIYCHPTIEMCKDI